MTHHLREAETIERESLRALHAVADEGLRARLGLRWQEMGDAGVSVAAGLPASAITINRALGLGHERPPQRADVESIAAVYREAGIKRFFLQPDPAISDDLMAPLCEAAGLRRARGWQKFERPADGDVPRVETEFEVRKASPEDGPAFARIVCAGFDLGDDAQPWLARLPQADGWHAYIAWDGDTPAGTGALFVHRGAAYADFGATDPAYRQRGAQSANLAHRIDAARDMGVARIHTCTGVAVPGDPQHSYANIEKVGFHPTHVRQAWEPVPGQ